MFEELISHGQDMVRRLEGQRGLSAEDVASLPAEQHVLVAESELWRTEVERRIRDGVGDYAFRRYEVMGDRLREEIREDVDSSIDRWLRWHRRVVGLLEELEAGTGAQPSSGVTP